MCWLIPIGLPCLSSMKFTSGNRIRIGVSPRSSYFVLIELPTTWYGGMP